MLAMVIAMPVEMVTCLFSEESSSLAPGPPPPLSLVPPNGIVCSRSIPSLNALQDDQIEIIACMSRAPAIAPGEVVTHDHFRSAKKEVAVRKKLRLSPRGATVSDVSDAEARLHTVTQEWSKSKYPYTTPPTGSEQFSNLFHNLDSRLDKASQNATEDRRAAAAAAEAAAAAAAAAAEAAAATAAADRQAAAAAAAAFAVEAANDRASAAADRLAIRLLIVKLDNQYLRAKNRQALIEAGARGGGQQKLFQLLKEQQGAGLALPGAGFAVAAPPVPVGFGEAVGAPFPDVVRHLNKLTKVQLSTLAILYNHHFGVVETDSLSERRAKFQAYIVGL
jgi:hypothetical protein